MTYLSQKLVRRVSVVIMAVSLNLYVSSASNDFLIDKLLPYIFEVTLFSIRWSWICEDCCDTF